jgi:CO/xanthine dehydrogenase FAD-binding subunit
MASDLSSVFTMLGATFHLAGPNGSRSVVASNFFTDLFKAALDENEI